MLGRQLQLTARRLYSSCFTTFKNCRNIEQGGGFVLSHLN
jgi:hypothetical protein